MAEERLYGRNQELTIRPMHESALDQATSVPPLESHLTHPIQQLNFKTERLMCNMLIIKMLNYNSYQE